MAGTAVATVHVAPADVMSGRGVADATWTSSDLRIASVAPATWDDSTATTVVTGYQGGRVTLTAMVRLRDSSTATVTASVVVRAANGMAVWPDTNALVPGVARTLSARDVADGSPYYAPAAGVRWVTDAPDVATVDSTGRVTPHASGRATVSAVRAVTGAGEQRASALVVVRTYPAPLVFRSIVTADPPPTHTDYPYPHSCGLTRDGRAYCWGENATGNLGTAEITDRCEEPVRSIPVEHQRDAIYRVVFSCSTTPVEVGGGHRFTQLSTYALHTCGVTTDGDVYCWGANDSGQAGSGDFATAREPRRADATVRFRSVNAGAGFTCALAESGAAYCWGLNAAGFSGLTIGSVGGLLGTGSSERVVTRPQLVLGGLTFASIAAGDGAVCAVTPAGAAYCWGVGDSGELGTERPATATCASATDTTCYAFALRLRVAPRPGAGRPNVSGGPRRAAEHVRRHDPRRTVVLGVGRPPIVDGPLESGAVRCRPSPGPDHKCAAVRCARLSAVVFVHAGRTVRDRARGRADLPRRDAARRVGVGGRVHVRAGCRGPTAVLHGA